MVDVSQTGDLGETPRTWGGIFASVRAWAEAAQPPADCIVLVPAVAGRSVQLRALRRQGPSWLPLPLPPIPVDAAPLRVVRTNLGQGRRDALDDLLSSIGLHHLLTLPLTPPRCGALLLARVESPFLPQEVDRELLRAKPLGRSLSTLAPREGVGEPGSAIPYELELLFRLTKDLTRAESPREAARVAAAALEELLQPAAGAVLVQLSVREPGELVAWPDGVLAEEAAQRARGEKLPPSDGRTWLQLPARPPGAGLALGWTRSIPERTQRIVQSAQGLLEGAVERLLAQRRREEDRLRAIVQGLPLGVVLLTAEGLVRLVNEPARALLPDDLRSIEEGQSLTAIDRLDLAGAIASAARGEVAQLELYLAERGGQHLSLRVVPAAAAGDDVLLVIDDVTEAKRRAQQLAQAEKLTALGTLISGVMHEVNNPLTTVIGYAQMLRATPTAPTTDRWLLTLTEEAQRCQSIVANLLDFARAQEARRSQISPAAIAEKALGLVASSLHVARVEASLDIAPETPVLLADAGALLRAVLNLLTNALHALEECKGERLVRLQVRPGPPGWVDLVVADNGPGIPPEIRSQIFDPFFTTKAEGRGTGLGLSLVAKTISEHGGEILLESAPGQGTSVTLRFPVEPGAGER